MTKPEAVTQEDREAYIALNNMPLDQRERIMAGEWDSMSTMQLLARHRIAAEQRGMERAADICAYWAEKYAEASDTAKVAKKRIETRDFESMGMACRFREQDIRQTAKEQAI